MANTIKPKRSNTANKVPTTSNLSSGEFGVNMADQKSYINNGTSIVQVGSGKLTGLQDVTVTSPTAGQNLSWNGTAWVNSSGGTGDVVGAASSTDNAIVRFDGTTGKLIQNSVATLDDTGVLTTLGANLDYMQIDTTATETIALGKTRWNAATGTQAFGIIDGTIECNIGEQLYAYVVNAEATTITTGQAVYLYQATGNKASVKLAYNTGDSTSSKTLGLVVADIAAGATGFVITQGVVGKLDTSTFTEGQTLYLGATAGSLTATKPSAPNHLVYIGIVERANAGNGQIYVKPQNGYELDEIHDVKINSPANGQTIIYDASTSLWKNANLTAGTGIGITNGASSITIVNSGVLGVTATSPVASSGGQNPVISMPAATTSVSGYLTSTDWNTFNGKGNGTVTSVGGTGTVAGISLSGTVTSSGNLTLGGTLNTTNNNIYDTFTADGSTTSFTTSTTYTSGKIEVFCNGVKMRNGTDVTVTSGTAVVFASAPANTSLIDLVYPV